jgi:hypothetical protein
MKKIQTIILIGILMFSTSGIFGTAQSEQNNKIITNSSSFEETCDCEAFMRTDDPSSYGYFVMDEPLYIDDSYVFDSPKQTIQNTPDEFSWKDFEGEDWTTRVTVVVVGILQQLVLLKVL